MKYHVSEDGVARPCKAQTVESCRATSFDGEQAPHADFASPQDAQRFAEAITSDHYETFNHSQGGYYANGVGPDEEAIKKASEEVVTGIDLAVGEDEVDSEGRHIDHDPKSSIRYVRDDEGWSSSGYPAWKLYGSSADVQRFLALHDMEVTYGENAPDGGMGGPPVVLKKLN